MYTVEDSELIADIRWRRHRDGKQAPQPSTTLTHYVVTTKGQVVEVIAKDIEVRRVEGLHQKLLRLAAITK